LEYFGNMPVVNGVVYGKYDVDRKLYRMRFIGGTDSRTWIMQLNSKVRGATTVSPAPIPFYVIGSEQGFLNNPVPRTQIVLMPGERIDVLVDFKAVPALDNQVILANYGPDTPYQGTDNGALSTVQSATIPEIMAFDVSAVTDALLTTSTAPTTSLRVLVPPLPPLPVAGALSAPFNLLTPTNNVRVIALEEITDQFGRIMPTIDRRGYDLSGMPATEIIKLNDVEEWDLVNTTADAHPMHLHLVAFQVVSRTPFDVAGFFKNNTGAVNDRVNNVFLPPTYVATGPAIAPGSFENGWKDTVFTPPGFVTKVRAKFDLAGEYVWHCHILSHEEHDMMRPMKTVALTANVPSSFAVPAAAQNDRTALLSIGSPVAQPGVTYKYVIEYTQTNSATLDTWHPVYSTGPTPTIVFPRDGIYQLRVKAADAGISPVAVDSASVAGSNTIVVATTSDLIYSPANGSILGGASQTFSIGTSGSYAHSLWVGTTAGGSDLGKFKVAAGVTTIPVTGLPVTGVPVYVRLITSIPVAGAPTENRFKDYVFTASSAASTALNVTAAPATLITSSGFTANWGVVATATGYFLDVSTNSAFSSFVTGYNNLPVATNTLAITGLAPATTYYYRVRARNATITGADSNMVSAVLTVSSKIGTYQSNREWHLDSNGNGIWEPAIDSLFSFGIAGDVAVSGVWNGTGTSKIGIFRSGQWYLDMNGNGIWDPATDVIRNFGLAGDKPVTGDWNGNGTTMIGVFRNGQWFLDMNGNGMWDPATDVIRKFGLAGDIPVTGDWNGSGTTKIGVYRNGQWFLDMNGNGIWEPGIDVIYNFGLAGDVPVTGDWDSSGKSEIGVFRNGQWFLDMNSNGIWDPATDVIRNFGAAGDAPVIGKW
jgi:FtsP/CotA-like multicopper oxidase with cupredoxin domain